MEPSLQKRIQHYRWDRAADSYETFWEKLLKPAPLLKISALIIGALTAATIVVQLWQEAAGYFSTIMSTLK